MLSNLILAEDVSGVGGRNEWYKFLPFTEWYDTFCWNNVRSEYKSCGLTTSHLFSSSYRHTYIHTCADTYHYNMDVRRSVLFKYSIQKGQIKWDMLFSENSSSAAVTSPGQPHSAYSATWAVNASSLIWLNSSWVRITWCTCGCS